MNDTLRYTSASIMAIVSTIGIAVNTYVLHALLTRKTNLSIFYKLCISKTICNIITNYYYMPHWVNIFWGQTAGWGAYVTGVCIQVSMKRNRNSNGVDEMYTMVIQNKYTMSVQKEYTVSVQKEYTMYV
uniref:7TM_GPCR_Srx domain-containing protein n=1 Tax=Caenorhabditis japonica TaxID=281687 RepID=A0A8R1I885_CAEJA